MTKPKVDDAQPGQRIPLHYHFHMLRDAARIQSFKEALDKVVPEGGRVLELGGGTGVLSFFAAKRALKVWCVETDPELVEASRRILGLNPFGQKVEVIHGDAMEFLPPEPVDVVICEMVHVAMLREKQIQAIRSFKERYGKKFGKKLPVFVPEGAILAVQPVFQLFNFGGFYAPTPHFYDPLVVHNETQGLGDPFNYQIVMYAQDLPEQLGCDTEMQIKTAGSLNALRFILKNAVAVLVPENRTIDWFSQYLVIPLAETLKVGAGDGIRVRFSYQPGDPISSLTDSIRVTHLEREVGRPPQTARAR